jgi:hypothetical protein
MRTRLRSPKTFLLDKSIERMLPSLANVRVRIFMRGLQRAASEQAQGKMDGALTDMGRKPGGKLTEHLWKMGGRWAENGRKPDGHGQHMAYAMEYGRNAEGTFTEHTRDMGGTLTEDGRKMDRQWTEN